MSQPSYQNLDSLLQQIDGSNGEAARRIYTEHRDLFNQAPGASSNHHTWPGGYADHITDAMNIVATLYDTLNAARPLPFSKSDALLVLFLHDLEKPFRYRYVNGVLTIDPSLSEKSAKATFRQDFIVKYGIELSPQVANALTYIERVPDAEYRPNARIMGELAALCHSADVLSARLWYNYPLPSGEDSWAGAGRANAESKRVKLNSEYDGLV